MSDIPGMSLGTESESAIDQERSKDHDALVSWIIHQIDVLSSSESPKEASISSIQAALSSLEITIPDIATCIQSVAARPWRPAMDQTADALLKRLGELAHGRGVDGKPLPAIATAIPEPPAIAEEDPDPAPPLDPPSTLSGGGAPPQLDPASREQLKRIALDVLTAPSSLFLHPRGLLKLIRIINLQRTEPQAPISTDGCSAYAERVAAETPHALPAKLVKFLGLGRPFFDVSTQVCVPGIPKHSRALQRIPERSCPIFRLST